MSKSPSSPCLRLRWRSCVSASEKTPCCGHHQGTVRANRRCSRHEYCCRCSTRLALQLIMLRKQRDEVVLEVERQVLLFSLLTRSWPVCPGPQQDSSQGVATHLTDYTGLAPVSRRSGSSIHGPPHQGREIKPSNWHCSCRPSQRWEIRSLGLTTHAK